jgi:hypothetical protein
MPYANSIILSAPNICSQHRKTGANRRGLRQGWPILRYHQHMQAVAYRELGRSAGSVKRRTRFGRRIQTVASPGLSIAESSRSGNMVDSYSRVEACGPLPAWIVMEHSRTDQRPADGPGNLLARDALYTAEVAS